ncbi:uncharacterized protein SPPG_08450 [Spizellomyces punctatus DAOM BR117]|uniref:Sulfhydryl oxidase n=1 Tax=Spizellomyces punctatus (strain DAOM BR117) TaxID=645134 RepID=A0A0L0H6E9_SPIPD|nr:uncharacterized protein SPPG_08450 [Spizellomyces punctatus DAOM BR117]KNC96298.1 hypothetical protein SPPG_08450 [Spizellomyces punctatus DAOM BR117]|eukprot:XP_016604338.1 hypothetical protein SPPG_08450 [Spizellomyces punctatus DAOM BR117]
MPSTEHSPSPGDPHSSTHSKTQKSCGVCSDFRTLRRKQAKEYRKSKAPATTTADAVTTASVPTQPKNSDAYAPFPCPPDSGTLGSSTWTFLHTMAAYYPENPSVAEQYSMRNLISALGRFYPCGYCAEHLKGEVLRRPPDVSSNRALSQWFCEVHNEVNERQGKPRFDCTKVFERWRDGSAGSECFPDIAHE